MKQLSAAAVERAMTAKAGRRINEDILEISSVLLWFGP
jgi:hypothetical protein